MNAEVYLMNNIGFKPEHFMSMHFILNKVKPSYTKYELALLSFMSYLLNQGNICIPLEEDLKNEWLFFFNKQLGFLHLKKEKAEDLESLEGLEKDIINFKNSFYALYFNDHQFSLEALLRVLALEDLSERINLEDLLKNVKPKDLEGASKYYEKLFIIASYKGKDYLYSNKTLSLEDSLVNKMLEFFDVQKNLESNSLKTYSLENLEIFLNCIIKQERELLEQNKIEPQRKELIREATEKQLSALTKALKSNFCILAGGPGTGKTTTIYKIIKYYLEYQNKIDSLENLIALTAPTGKAVSRLKESIQGQDTDKVLENEKNTLHFLTLHKLLGISPYKPKGSYNLIKPLPYQFVIVDEASMIDLDLMLILLNSLSPNTKLLLVGDEQQLPSIGRGTIFKDLKNIMEDPQKEVLDICVRSNVSINNLSKSLQESKDPKVFLSHIKKENIIGLTRQNINQIPIDQGQENLIKEKNQFFRGIANDLLTLNTKVLTQNDFILKGVENGIWKEGPLYARDFLNNIQNIFNNYLKQVFLSPVKEGDLGVYSLNKNIALKIKDALGNPLEELAMLYMVTKNDYELNLANGDLAIVFYLEDRHDYFLVVQREKNIFEAFPFNKVAYKDLAFSISIHKSQGSEYHNVYIFMPNYSYLGKELLYTAITRAKEQVMICYDRDNTKLEDIFEKNIQLQELIRHSLIKEKLVYSKGKL